MRCCSLRSDLQVSSIILLLLCSQISPGIWTSSSNKILIMEISSSRKISEFPKFVQPNIHSSSISLTNMGCFITTDSISTAKFSPIIGVWPLLSAILNSLLLISRSFVPCLRGQLVLQLHYLWRTFISGHPNVPGLSGSTVFLILR